jgi:hypothetical protein
MAQSMESIHTRILADDELRTQLEAGATIFFDGRTIHWHGIERQVERLGFGDLYIVSATQGPLGDNSKVSVKPDLTGRLSAQISDALAPATGEN